MISVQPARPDTFMSGRTTISLYFAQRAVAREHRVHFCDRRCTCIYAIYGVSLTAQRYAEVCRKCNEGAHYIRILRWKQPHVLLTQSQIIYLLYHDLGYLMSIVMNPVGYSRNSAQ